MIAIYILPHPTVPLILVLRAKQQRCKEQIDCSLTDVFSLQDLVGFGDLALGQSLGGYIVFVILMHIIGNLIMQFYVVKSIKRELVSCLKYLEQYCLNLKPRADYQLEMEKTILITLVKLTLSSEDIKKNAYFVSRVIEAYCSIMILFLVSFLIVNHISGNTIQFRVVLIGSAWMGVNLLWLSCAYVNSHTINSRRSPGLSWPKSARATRSIGQNR